jgi:3-dehydrosphinganine reductase
MSSSHALRRGQHAVITGGSSGLGLALATALAQRGLDVTLLARDRDRLDQAKEHIASVAPQAQVRLYAVDVSDFEATEAAIDDLTGPGIGINVVINSAGIVREGYFEATSSSDFRTVMEIDFFGTLNVTRACLSHLRASGGRVVNISSMAGLVGVFGETAYCAAKYAVTGFSEALRLEVEPQGVTVQLVCPGQFDTPMVEELNTYRTPENGALVGAFGTMPLDEVTREVINGIDRGSPLIIPGRIMRVSWFAQRIAPGLLRRFMRRQVASVYQGPSRAA